MTAAWGRFRGARAAIVALAVLAGSLLPLGPAESQAPANLKTPRWGFATPVALAHRADDLRGQLDADDAKTTTFRIPASLFKITVVDRGGFGCSNLEFVQFPAVPGAVSYTVSVVIPGTPMASSTFHGPPFQDHYDKWKQYVPPPGVHQFDVYDYSIFGGGNPSDAHLWAAECAKALVKDPYNVSDPMASATVVKCGLPGGGPCLQAYIKIVGPIPNVGTRSGLSVDKYVPDDGPVNFTRLTGSEKATPLVEAASTGQQCVSGCANILITVVNKVTHKPAVNAEVNVQLGAIDTEESPGLHQQGTQFLCLQTDSSVQHCGTSLDRLKLDGNGQVRVLYWAPGELVSAHAELYAQACTASACALERAESKITVYPYRIFHYQGELSPETVQELVEMVQSEGIFDIVSHAAEFGLEAAVKAWIELLGVESHAVELVLGPIGFLVAFTIIDLAHATSELLEEAGLRSAFFDASGLSEAGLLSDEFAKVLSPGDAAAIEGEVLTGGKVFTHPSGWLFELGKQYAKKYGCCAYRTETSLFKPEPLDLSVYETSYCSQYTNQEFHSLGEEAHCGPGYGSLHSPNIRTDLCIDIVQLVVPTCGGQYDAPIWVVSQEGVDKDLHHPDALDTSLP